MNCSVIKYVWKLRSKMMLSFTDKKDKGLMGIGNYRTFGKMLTDYILALDLGAVAILE